MSNHKDTSLNIWNLLMDQGDQSIDQIISCLSISKKVAYAALKRMKDSGHITCFEGENPLYVRGVAYSRPLCTFFSATPHSRPSEAATKAKSGPKTSTAEARKENPQAGNKYLSDLDLANRYRVSRVTPWRWAKKGAFPAPVKLGENCTRWKLSDIEEWETRREEEQ